MIPHPLRAAICLLILLSSVLCGHVAQAQHEQTTLPQADLIVVHKKEHELELWRDGETILKYPIALGFNPVGHKIYQGDGKTPEGVYTIIEKKQNSGFHRALMLNYPNEADKQTAAAQGLTPGAYIAIHGMPNGQTPETMEHPKRDWTDGCVALTDAQIDTIWERVAPGTPVLIMP